MADYRFSITPYDTKTTVDVESQFNCRYKEAKGLTEKGEVANIYFEDYAEMDGCRAYIPNEPKHKSTEVTIVLLFNGFDPLHDAMAFAGFIDGRKIEWHDTFRGAYVTLVSKKPPTVSQEKLYGDMRYRLVTFTFTNIHGTYFDTSQIR